MTAKTIKFPTNASILVVDDEPHIRETLCEGIQISGYDCQQADGANQALEILNRQPIDVLISDINMPEIDGLELLKTVRRDFGTNVIIMTGYIDDFTYEEIVGLGASDFIQKPVRIEEIIARIRRVLIERANLKERNIALAALQENLAKSQRAMVAVIQAIATAIEMRDPYTSGHQQRVAELACAMGSELNLTEHDLFGLRMACVLHDLGKITVPSEILSRPGVLSDLEYGIVQNHVQAGYDIIKNIEFPWPLREIIVQHHERMDGSGYPNGLKGNEILMEARILAVADVFETISSHRPYRPSLGINRAIEEISTSRGLLYDPNAVDVCLSLFQEGKFVFKPTEVGMNSRASTKLSIP
ncbi:MAG: response regulator [Deltaproteobacteria bacterium]|nr:response regulator [Deltaproteobacteria bacterium]